MIQCKKFKKINIKGKSYPIQTYQVENFINNNNSNKVYSEEIQGFSFNLDLNILKKDLYVKKYLKDIILKCFDDK